jgi:hypothetical protein
MYIFRYWIVGNQMRFDEIRYLDDGNRLWLEGASNLYPHQYINTPHGIYPHQYLDPGFVV